MRSWAMRRSIVAAGGAALLVSACSVGDLAELVTGVDIDEGTLDELATDTAEETHEEDRADEADDGPTDPADEVGTDGDGSGDAEGEPDDGDDPTGTAGSEDSEPADDGAEQAADADDAGAPGAEGQAACTGADSALEPGVPDQAERVEQATGDLTGDGNDDTIITYAVGDGVFMLRFETASGYVVEASLDDASEVAPVQPLGAASIGGDREVAWVLESTGASGVNVGLWALHEQDDHPCALLPVTIPDHTADRTFSIGGTASGFSALACGDATGDGSSELRVLRAEAAGDDQFTYQTSAWSWDGAGALTFVTGDEGTVDDPAALDDGQWTHCDGVDLS